MMQRVTWNNFFKCANIFFLIWSLLFFPRSRRGRTGSGWTSRLRMTKTTTFRITLATLLSCNHIAEMTRKVRIPEEDRLKMNSSLTFPNKLLSFFSVMSEILDNFYASNQTIGDGSTRAGEKVRQVGSRFEQKDRMDLVTSWEEIPAYWY